VVIPEFTTRRWRESLLYNQSAWLLKALLARRPSTVTVSVPLVLSHVADPTAPVRPPTVRETTPG
jgi:hypothetical protein